MMTTLGIPLSTDFGHVLYWSPINLALAGLIIAFLSLLCYASHTPKLPKNVPEFTSDTLPLVGSWRFFDQKWSFWKRCVEKSKTGNFSFWLGQHHIVGVSGMEARKNYLENPDLCFLHGNVTLLGLGPDYKLPLHEIFKPTFHNGRSYFQRRLIELTKTAQLARRLPRVSRDARVTMERLTENSSRVTNPFTFCYPIILSMSCRIVFTDEIPDNPQTFDRCLRLLSILQSTSSRHNVIFPWLPSIALLKRWYARDALTRLISPIIDRRIKKKDTEPRSDDGLQVLLDHGDSKENMSNFAVSIIFIAIANAGVLAGVLLHILAHRADWQERIYDEIRAVAATYSKDDGPLIDQLASIPLEAWESSLPSIELCFQEAIRMNTAFPMFRQNIGSTQISIPGSNEVIPQGSFASYNTADVHYDEDLYPDPFKFDPTRFGEGRREFEKQNHSSTANFLESVQVLGWGHGKHPCLGMRWAKLQQNIILAHALALYQWTGCDANGQLIPPLEPNINLDAAAPGLPQGVYCKYVSRESV